MRAFIIAAAMIAVPAAAEPPAVHLKQDVPIVVMQCGPRSDVAEAIARNWGERRLGHAYAHRQQTFVEFWVSAGGTWTITETTAEGTTCIVRHGINWHMRPGVGS